MTTSQQTPTFEDLELLVEVSKLLTLRDINTVMERVIDLTADAVGAQKASLFLLNGVEVEWDYIFTARALEGTESIRVVATVLDEGLAGWVMRNRTAALIEDTETDPRWHIFPDDTRVVRSAMCIPFLNEGEPVAVLTLDHPEPNRFTEYQLRLMTIISNQATVAIRNAQLFKRLLDKQRQLEAVLQSVPDVMLVTDIEANVLLMNLGAASMLHLDDMESGLGRPITEYAEQHDVIAELIQHLMTNPISYGQETSFEARSDRRKRDYAVTVSRWEENAGKIGGNVVIMHDVTTLRDLFRFKDEMLKMASHDLRSPLSTISGYADMVEYDTPEDSPLREYTEAIHRSVKRMSDLLEDLLKVRQIDEKGLNLEAHTVMIDLVRPVYQGVVLSARQKNQTVQEDIQLDDGIIATVDPMLMRQAMENFASNAVKYTPEGGQITIRAYVNDGKFFYEVEDTGIGIPPDALPRLFESFYRVNPKANASISGAGLGLSLVKSIIERHQGEVWVQSEEGVGSLFGLWLPM
ncbi:MAG: ATP-binding protein [Chloroflexota bacterium]